MAKVERHIVTPPNQELQGLAATRSQAPPPSRPAVRGSNSSIRAGDPGGSADLTRRVSPVAPISQKFNVDNARMPQPPAARAPGKGEIPVNPIQTPAQVATATAIADDALYAERTR